MSIDTGRRTLVKGVIGWGAGLTVASVALHAQDDPSTSRPKEGDLLVRVGDTSLTPLTPNEIPASALQTMAWALDPAAKVVRDGSRLNRILLVRLDPGQYSPETRARAAGGVVAYTAICTHTGCEVSEWLPDQEVFHCPCHFSKFDPKDGARVVDGPAPRTLPALPLKIVDGNLVVAGAFTARVGFEAA
jgi:rieske iron-sulfur protein